MKLVQFAPPGGGKRVGLVDGDRVLDITARREGIASVLDLVVRGGTAAAIERLARRLRRMAGSPTAYAVAALDRAPGRRTPHFLLPLDPPEVWGAGITYRRSADFYTQATGREKGIYDHVYDSERPELFFKATASRCAGPNAPVRVRSDSRLTAPEPELAFVLGARGAIVGYTLSIDVAAWDIERENPLFLPQSKVFAGCCALGPALVTAGEIPDAHAIEIACRIWRRGRQPYEWSVNAGR